MPHNSGYVKTETLKNDSHKNHLATAVSEGNVQSITNMLLLIKLRRQKKKSTLEWPRPLLGEARSPGSDTPFSPISRVPDVPGLYAQQTPARNTQTSGLESWAATCRVLWTAAASSLWRQSSGQLVDRETKEMNVRLVSKHKECGRDGWLSL